jgi:small subunit ribosomal protein S1
MGEEQPPTGPTVFDESYWAALIGMEEEGRVGARPAGQKLQGSGERTGEPASQSDADFERAEQLQAEERILECRVTGFNRGGLLVEGNGLPGFVPASHLVGYAPRTSDAGREAALKEYVGKTLLLKVIECDPDRKRIVLSERAGRAAPGARQRLFQEISVGLRLRGTVTNITPFGVFVDLGGVEGLAHISELSWGRVSDPGQVCSPGQVVEVQVTAVDAGRGRIALSLKRLKANPWAQAEVRYPVGTVVMATISEVVPFGAFARLEDGLEGLIHVSEMNLPVGETLAIGQSVDAEVLAVNPERQRLSLRLRAPGGV